MPETLIDPVCSPVWSSLITPHFLLLSLISSLSFLILHLVLTFTLDYWLSVRSNLFSPVLSYEGLAVKGRKKKTTGTHGLQKLLSSLLPWSLPGAISFTIILWGFIFCLFSLLCLVISTVPSLSLRVSGLHSFILLRGHDHVRPLYHISFSVSSFLFLLLCETCTQLVWTGVDMTASGPGRRSVCVCVFLSKVICNCMFSDTVMDNQ